MYWHFDQFATPESIIYPIEFSNKIFNGLTDNKLKNVELLVFVNNLNFQIYKKSILTFTFSSSSFCRISPFSAVVDNFSKSIWVGSYFNKKRIKYKKWKYTNYIYYCTVQCWSAIDSIDSVLYIYFCDSVK